MEDNFETRMNLYLAACKAAWLAANPDSQDTFEVVYGNRYGRVVRVQGGQEDGELFVHSFIDTSNGDVYKAASAKAPATNHVRGNVFDDNVTEIVGTDGVAHLKRGRKPKQVATETAESGTETDSAAASA